MVSKIISPSIFQQYFDNDGFPLSGGKIYTFRSGTSVPKNTYQDSDAITLNPNPIILDEAGRAIIYIEANTEDNDPESSAYRFVLYSKDNVLIDSVDNIYPINGVNGKNTGTIVRGSPGGPGAPGKSIVGPDGPVGPVGPMGRNGKISIMWRKAGEYDFTVPPNVYEIDVEEGGAGGGFYIEQPLPKIGSVGSGIAGKIVRTTINVNPGEVIKIRVGAGGKASTSILEANGQSTTISSDNLGTITAAGGTAGNTVNISYSQAYFQKMSPFFQAQTFNGFIPSITPQPVMGESSPYGKGGDIYKGSADATGNCASGGSGIPVVSNNILQISAFGAGGDGIVIFEYLIVDNEDE